MTRSGSDRLAFFLGGYDLEMITIRDLVAEAAPGRLFDKALRWGAKASAYRDEIDGVLAHGLEPVLVELEDDVGIPGAHVIVDHHGERAGSAAPASIEQVFALLELPRERWTRWFDLVAANDRGHIREMRTFGATAEEIDGVRAADRRAQGITEEDERAGEESLRQGRLLAEGRLLVVELPHAHTAVVADRVESQSDPPENLLVFCPEEVDFYGSGYVVGELAGRYRGSWSGGALPERGFWGQTPIPEGILDVVIGVVGAE